MVAKRWLSSLCQQHLWGVLVCNRYQPIQRISASACAVVPVRIMGWLSIGLSSGFSGFEGSSCAE